MSEEKAISSGSPSEYMSAIVAATRSRWLLTVDLTLLQRRLGGRELGLGGGELGLHLGVALPGHRDLAARRRQLGLGVGELGPGGLEARAGAAQLRARLVEVVLGALELPLDLLLLVLEVVGDARRRRPVP